MNLVDYYIVRRGHYAIAEIFNPQGMYGRWGWRGIGSYLVGFAAMLPFLSTSKYAGFVADALNGADTRHRLGLRPHVALGVFYLVAGSLHFVRPPAYEAMMPDPLLPAKRELVYASGAAELIGGTAVLHPRTRVAGGWWLIATLLAIFPANVHMALHAQRFRKIPEPLLWLRLPVQALLVRWAWRAAIRPSR